MNGLSTLFMIGLGVFILAAVGHGIWIIGASIVQALSGGFKYKPPWYKVFSREELDAACRYCHRLLQLRRIDLAVFHHLRDLIDADYQRLGQKPPPREIAPGVLAPPVAALPKSAPAPVAAGAPSDAPAIPVTPSEKIAAFISEQTARPTADVIDAEIVFADVVDSVMPAGAMPASAMPPRATASSVTPPAQPAKSPFDFPDEPAKRPKQRSWAVVLQAFMQEKNVRWGELVSGMLIVGSAVGLVVSLRHELQRTIPYFSAVLFMLITAAIHGAGIYTLRKWKLQSTSRGVLTIGLLLVPLNFLTACVLADGSQGRALTGLPFLGAVLLGTAVFAALVCTSSYHLFSKRTWWTVSLSVLGCSLWQVVLHRTITSDTPFVTINLLTAPLVLLFLGGTLAHAYRYRRSEDEPNVAAEKLLLALGLSVFALVCGFAMVAIAQHDLRRALAEIGPVLVPLSALGWLLSGARLQSDEIPNWQRVTASALIILGILLAAFGVILAWPQPERIIMAGLASACVLAASAWFIGEVWVTASALAGIAIAYFFGWHLALGHYGSTNTSLIAQHWKLLFTSSSSVSLLIFAVLTALVGAAARTYRRDPAFVRHAMVPIIGSIASAAFSIALALIASVITTAAIDLQIASAVLLANALVILIAGGLLVQRPLMRVGEALLFVGFIHLFHYSIGGGLAWDLQGAPLNPHLAAIWSYALFCVGCSTIVAIGARVAPESVAKTVRTSMQELAYAAIASAVLGAGASVTAHLNEPIWVVVDFSCLAIVFLQSSIVFRSPALFAALQATTYGLALASLNALAIHWQWKEGWYEPRLLAWQLGALALVSHAWNGICLLLRRVTKSLFPKELPLLDQVVSAGLLIVVLLLGVAACMPGITAEFQYGLSDSFLSLWARDWQASYMIWWPWALAFSAVLVGAVRPKSELVREAVIVGMFTALLAAASYFTESSATASAVRWFCGAGLFVFAIVTIALRQWGRSTSKRVLTAAITLGAVPLVIVMAMAIFIGASGGHFGGPAANVFFGRLIVEANYGVPLVLVLAALSALSWGRRDASFVYAGAVLQLFLVAVWVFAGIELGAFVRHGIWMTGICQTITLLMALYAVNWTALNWTTLNRRTAAHGDSSPQMTYAKYLQLGFIGCAAVMAVAPALLAICAVLFRHLDVDPIWFGTASQPLAWCATLATAAAILHLLSRRDVLRIAPVLCVFSLALLGLATASVAAHWRLQPWYAVRTLGVGQLVLIASWLAFSRRWLPDPANERQVISLLRVQAIAFAVGVLIIFATVVRLDLSDPAPQWWITSLLGVLTLMTMVASTVVSPAFAYVGTVSLIATFGFLVDNAVVGSFFQRKFFAFHCCAISIAAYALIGLVIDLRQRKHSPRLLLDRIARMPGMAAIALAWLYLVLVGINGLARVAETNPSRAEMGSLLGWLALLAIGLLLVACLWDRANLSRLSSLYAWGLSLASLGVMTSFTGDRLFASWPLAVVVFCTLVAWAWRNQTSIWRLFHRAGITDAGELLASTGPWLSRTQIVLLTLAILTQLVTILSIEERGLRMAAAFTPLMGALALAAMGSVSKKSSWQQGLPMASLALFSVFCVFASWIDLAPSDRDIIWLSRLVRLVIVFALLTFIYGAIIPRTLRVTGIWTNAFKRTTTAVAACALGSLVLLLVIEVANYRPGVGVPITVGEAAVVAVMLVAMAVGLVAVAVLPQGRSLAVSFRARVGYVYAAEVVAAMVGLHVVLTMPWLLRPEWRVYWPYGVMALAFAGVGASEIFRRRSLDVLAEPLLRTGLLLPFVPFIVMWLAPSNVDYAMVLFLGSVLYFILAMSRSSPTYAIFGTACGNVALWTLLRHHASLDFFRHPQIWLIPPAASVLMAAHWNRDRLTNVQRSLVRYGCVMVIYLSSTCEVFIAGIGEQIWPPIVLILLAVAGVMAGIVLQLRAFLLLGSVFVFISLLSMVMHAQQSLHHVWPWWAFGIGLGIAILTMFGLFEKKRPELVEMLQRLKQWEG